MPPFPFRQPFFPILPVLILLLTQIAASQHIQPKTGNDDPCSNEELTNTCPVTCFRVNPVCGVDDVTYWCGCSDAACHGVRVSKLGPCEIGNSGRASLPGQALLLIHIIWLVLLGLSLLLGLF